MINQKRNFLKTVIVLPIISLNFLSHILKFKFVIKKLDNKNKILWRLKQGD